MRVGVTPFLEATLRVLHVPIVLERIIWISASTSHLRCHLAFSRAYWRSVPSAVVCHDFSQREIVVAIIYAKIVAIGIKVLIDAIVAVAVRLATNHIVNVGISTCS